MSIRRKLSDEEINVMQHALGMNAGQKPHRNYFYARVGHENWDHLLSLCGLEFMSITRQPSELTGDSYVFRVTEKGRAYLGLVPGAYVDDSKEDDQRCLSERLKEEDWIDWDEMPHLIREIKQLEGKLERIRGIAQKAGPTALVRPEAIMQILDHG